MTTRAQRLQTGNEVAMATDEDRESHPKRRRLWELLPRRDAEDPKIASRTWSDMAPLLQTPIPPTTGRQFHPPHATSRCSSMIATVTLGLQGVHSREANNGNFTFAGRQEVARARQQSGSSVHFDADSTGGKAGRTLVFRKTTEIGRQSTIPSTPYEDPGPQYSGRLEEDQYRLRDALLRVFSASSQSPGRTSPP